MHLSVRKRKNSSFKIRRGKSQVTELLINKFIFGGQFGHLAVAREGRKMSLGMSLGEYYRRLHQEHEPDENELMATLEKEGFTPLDFLRSVVEELNRAENVICHSSDFSSEKLGILLQGGFLREIGKSIEESTINGSILSITKLGKAAATLMTRCGDVLARTNPNSEKMTHILIKEFRVINSGRPVLDDGRPIVFSGEEVMRMTPPKEEQRTKGA